MEAITSLSPSAAASWLHILAGLVESWGDPRVKCVQALPQGPHCLLASLSMAMPAARQPGAGADGRWPAQALAAAHCSQRAPGGS